MRTTITLDSDVAAMLRRETRRRGVRPKAILNEALRRAFRAGAESPSTAGRRFATKVKHGGRCLLGDLVDVSAALEAAEGPGHR